jgi:hypothetical protein
MRKEQEAVRERQAMAAVRALPTRSESKSIAAADSDFAGASIRTFVAGDSPPSYSPLSCAENTPHIPDMVDSGQARQARRRPSDECSDSRRPGTARPS